MELRVFFYGFISYKKFMPFFLLGWCAPLFPTIMWTVLQASYYSEQVHILKFPDNTTQKFSIGDCWMQSWVQPVCLQHHWMSELVIEGPIIISLLLNFYIFVKVLSMISSMNRHHNTQSKVKLMKSTMTLIPLLGLFYLGTMLLQDCSYQQAENNSLSLKSNPIVFATKILSHRLPAIIVTFIYCFFNSEVNELFKLYFQKLALGREIDIDALRRRSTISNSSRRSSHRKSFIESRSDSKLDGKNDGKIDGKKDNKHVGRVRGVSSCSRISNEGNTKTEYKIENQSRNSAVVFKTGDDYVGQTHFEQEAEPPTDSGSRKSSGRKSSILNDLRFFTRSMFVSTRHNSQKRPKIVCDTGTDIHLLETDLNSGKMTPVNSDLQNTLQAPGHNETRYNATRNSSSLLKDKKHMTKCFFLLKMVIFF